MNRKHPSGIAALLVLAAIGCALPIACRRSDAHTTTPPTSVLNARLPAVQESLDDIRAQMAKLVRVENEHHVISSPDEFDNWRLKALVKLDEMRRREGVAGFTQAPVEKTGSQNGVVDAASHKIAWRASTCWNPPCLGKGKGGGPVVFARQWENASIGPDGNLIWRTLTDKEPPPAITCPVCGLPDFVQYYDAPEVEVRRRQLTEEMKESRRIRAEAEAAGKLVPAGVRTPNKIMKELTELPKLFLVPQNGS